MNYFTFPGIPTHFSEFDAKNLVCKEWGVTKEQLDSKSRIRRLAEARQFYCWLMTCKSRQTLKEIGYSIGKRDHSTVIHSKRTTNSMLETDANFYERIRRLLAGYGMKLEEKETEEGMIYLAI